MVRDALLCCAIFSATAILTARIIAWWDGPEVIVVIEECAAPVEAAAEWR